MNATTDNMNITTDNMNTPMSNLGINMRFFGRQKRISLISIISLMHNAAALLDAGGAFDRVSGKEKNKLCKC